MSQRHPMRQPRLNRGPDGRPRGAARGRRDERRRARDALPFGAVRFRHDRPVSDSLIAYALTHATPDVAKTLRWLECEFALVTTQGGATEPFGNALLEFRRLDVGVRIIRDKSQWILDFSTAPDQIYRGLHVLWTAMTDEQPEPRLPRDDDGELPSQLPAGVAWADRVPAIVAWLAADDRGAEIAAADQWWRAAMKAYWNEEQRQDPK